MTNYTTGHDAEKAAAKYLAGEGFKIIELNWKTRYCEIDIVAKQDDIIYFIEVKHRSNDRHGDGFAYITPKKLQQMQFAAEMWFSAHDGEYDCQLAAIASGPDGFEMLEI